MTSATMADVLPVAAAQQFLKQWRTFSERRKLNLDLEKIIMSRRRRARESFLVFLREVLRRNLNSERCFWIEPGRTGNYFWERTVSTWMRAHVSASVHCFPFLQTSCKLQKQKASCEIGLRDTP